MSILDQLMMLVPGLMAYFWIEKIGITPAVKPTNLEQTAIGIILWLPTFLLSVYGMKISGHTLPIFNASTNATTLTDQQMISLAWFLLFSSVASLIISAAWAYVFYPAFIAITNGFRWSLGRGKLERETTVFEKMFGKSFGLVVRINKIGSIDDGVIGQIDYSSRPLSGEQSFILTEELFWKTVISKGEVRIDRRFINTDKGIIIEELNYNDLKLIINQHPELLLLPQTSRRK